MLLFFLSSFVVVWHFYLSFFKNRLQEAGAAAPVRGWEGRGAGGGGAAAAQEAGSSAGSLGSPLLHLLRSHEDS